MAEAASASRGRDRRGRADHRPRRLRRRRRLLDRDPGRARCATLGADVDWLSAEPASTTATGSTAATVERLAARGTELLITVDCGITAVDEVAAARAAGHRGDRHRPPPAAASALPGLPDRAPARSAATRAPDLCAAGVAYKLAAALLAAAGEDADADEDLDLVALATVADLVAAAGREPRARSRAGCAAARQARKAGLRALMDVARVDPSGSTRATIGFRLGPRINAAGRLYRADAGVELLLTADARAGARDRGRARRASTPSGATSSAGPVRGREALRARAPEQLGDAAGLVLAGEGWHPGVVGIVASRIAERHHRPAILIALDGDGGPRLGPQRSPASTCSAALDACARAPAPLRRPPRRGRARDRGRPSSTRSARAFAPTPSAALADRPTSCGPRRSTPSSGATSLGHDVAEELERLAPFGIGNPAVRLLVPSAQLADVRPMGEGDATRVHARGGARRALGVAFGVNGSLDGGRLGRARSTSRSSSS